MCDGGPAREKVRVPRRIIMNPSTWGNTLSPEDDDDDDENENAKHNGSSATFRSHRNRGRRNEPYLRPGARGGLGNTHQSSSAQARQRQIQSSSDPFQRYVAALGRMQLHIKSIEGDGNCMFRSISHQMYVPVLHCSSTFVKKIPVHPIYVVYLFV